ncbi:MAG TPA: hypothetical protein VJL81_04925 [Solirubrobacterales bacterium]|nr:hypothetical protein [Solirubrobacterales bacterium]
MFVHEPPRIKGISELEDALGRSFELIRAALEAGESVAIVLDDRDLQGNSGPAAAGQAGGLLGLSRALAFEGRKAGWQVAVLATTPAASEGERDHWLRALENSRCGSGALIRLAGDHLGKLPV